MKEAQDIARGNARLVRLLRKKLGVRARDLRQGVHRAGRRLPRRVRAQGALLAEAERMGEVPKLARQVDWRAVRDAHQVLERHLTDIDVMDRRKGIALGLAGTIAAQLLVVTACFIIWLWWRGYV